MHRIIDNRIENQIGIIAILLDVVLVQAKIRLLIMSRECVLKTNTLIRHIFKYITQFGSNI